MSVTIEIDPKTEAHLRRQAEAAGTDFSVYISRLVEDAASRRSLDEILAPLRQEFAASGMSEEELVDLITTTRDTYRREKQAGQ